MKVLKHKQSVKKSKISVYASRKCGANNHKPSCFKDPSVIL